MDIDITIDDPKAYEKPWRTRVPAHLLPDFDLIETFCEKKGTTATSSWRDRRLARVRPHSSSANTNNESPDTVATY